MADEEPDEVRPRRALIEDPRPESAAPRRAHYGSDDEDRKPLLGNGVSIVTPRRSAGADATQSDPSQNEHVNPDDDDPDNDVPDDHDPDDHRRLRRRTKIALVVATVAAVVVAGFAIGYGVLAGPKTAGAADATGAAATTAPVAHCRPTRVSC